MKKAVVILFMLLACYGYSQDKIYRKDGTIIKCKITDNLDDKVFYTLGGDDDLSKEITKGEIDLIKYEDGRTEDYSGVKEEKSTDAPARSNGDKFDRNSEEFVNYANALAKQLGESLLRECAGKYDNAFTSVYFDACFKDPFSGEISIPIRVSYIKGVEQRERFIKGIIKIKKDGSKEWVYQDSQNMFTNCAKKYIFK